MRSSSHSRKRVSSRRDDHYEERSPRRQSEHYSKRRRVEGSYDSYRRRRRSRSPQRREDRHRHRQPSPRRVAEASKKSAAEKEPGEVLEESEESELALESEEPLEERISRQRALRKVRFAKVRKLRFESGKRTPTKVASTTKQSTFECESNAESEESVDLFSASADCLVSALCVGDASVGEALNGGGAENYDDSDGYYVFKLGDTLDGRYTVTGDKGRGVFSSVLCVEHTADGGTYVVKVTRNNAHMAKAGVTEMRHLLAVARFRDSAKGAAAAGCRHIVRLLDHFWHRQHLCLVLEAMDCNLRQLIRNVGAGEGLHVSALRSFASQLLKALCTLKALRIVHTDLKPDNVLVAQNCVKLCDLGSGLHESDAVVTPLLGSRYYRGFEAIVGLLWAAPVDVWSLACVLFELYTGRILFRGESNNQMLFLQLQVSGGCKRKVLTDAAFYEEHFAADGSFLQHTVDSVTGLPLKQTHHFAVGVATRPLLPALHPTASAQRAFQRLPPTLKAAVHHFADLLRKMLTLDPIKRITPNNALKHPFFATKK